MPTMITVAESTENVPSARRVRDVDRRIHYLDPDIAPLTVLLNRSGRSRAAMNSKFEWIEKDLAPWWDAINNGAGYSATATALVVDNGAYFTPGDVVEVVRTAEKFRVVSISSNTLTVVRAVDGDGVNGSAILDNDDLLIIGNAYREGAVSEVEKSTQETYPFNYAQIVRTPFGTTGTESVSENYTGPDRPRLRMEKANEHKIHLEHTAIFGERNLFTTGDSDASTGKPRRYTGGFLYYFGTASNVKDAGGILTEAELEDWLADVFHHTASGDTRVLFAAPKVISVLDQLAAGRLQTVPSDKTFGIAVKEWLTSHGRLMIVKHRLLENGPISSQGYGGYALAADVGKLTYTYLRERNTKLMIDIHANDYDGWKDEYKTEMGWQMENPKVHGVLKNVTG